MDFRIWYCNIFIFVIRLYRKKYVMRNKMIDNIQPYGHRTEQEDWGEDSGRLEIIKMLIERGYVTKDINLDDELLNCCSMYRL